MVGVSRRKLLGHPDCLKKIKCDRDDCHYGNVAMQHSLTCIFVILHVGGRTSGIFGDPEPPAQAQRTMPPGGLTSNIFGSAESAPGQSPSRGHPNKPKVWHASECYTLP